MALVLADRVKVRSHTAGTGTITLADTALGFQNFEAVGTGNETYYGIIDNVGNWEIGRGTYTKVLTVETLTRDTVISSSNNNSLVNFPVGGKNVFGTFPANLAQAIEASTTNSFSTIQVSGQSNLVADSSSDTLTLIAGNNVTITTDNITDAITINATSGLGDLQVAETEGIFNKITGTALGTGILLDVEEPSAVALGGAVFLTYRKHVDSVDPNTGTSHLAVTPYGVEVSTNNSNWTFNHNGSLNFNNHEVYIATNNWGITAPANANTVVYTQKSINPLASIRVHATIEGNEDGDTTGNHSQACDMMIVRRVSNLGVSTVDSVVYGVICTGVGPLATLDAQWNAVTNKIEITATPVSTTTTVFVKVYATEVARGD